MNLWIIVMRYIYEGGKQFESKNEFWEVTLPVCEAITTKQINFCKH